MPKKSSVKSETAKKVAIDPAEQHRIDADVSDKYLSRLIQMAVPFPPKGENFLPTLREKQEAAVALVRSLKPTSQHEVMITSAIAAAHFMGMEFTYRSLNEPDAESAGKYANCAARAFAAFQGLSERLDKHRGKGQQTYTVKHVHVAPGAQAIVGDVNEASATTNINQQPSEAPSESFERAWRDVW